MRDDEDMKLESWGPTPWGKAPTDDHCAFYRHKPAPMECMHGGLRCGEPLLRELGFILKKLKGKEAVDMFIKGLQGIPRQEKLQPLVYMLKSWLKNSFAKATPQVSLYSASPLPCSCEVW